MTIAVFHCAFGETMKLVARVETENLEVAYKATNSINSAWYEGACESGVLVEVGYDVTVEAAKGCRSTSMYDIMVNLTDGKMYRVEMCGFDEINEDDWVTLDTINSLGERGEPIRTQGRNLHTIAVDRLKEAEWVDYK